MTAPHTILAASAAEPPQDLTDDQTRRATEEALDASANSDFLGVGTVHVPVRFLSFKHERKMIRIIAPYLRLLTEASQAGAFEQVLAAALINAEADVFRLTVLVLVPQAEVLGILPAPPELPDGQTYTPEQRLEAQVGVWVEENARFEQMAALVLAQVQKNKLGEALGKLWQPGALGVGLLRVLNTLPHQITHLLQLKSTESPAATESSPPSA